MNGTAAALFVSPLPFQGPVASVRVGRVNDEFVPFPTQDELEESELDLIVSGSEEAVAMIEGFARELPEDVMTDAILFGHSVIKELCALQRELAEKIGVEKIEFVPPEDDGLLGQLSEKYYDEFKSTKQTEGKQARAEAVSALKERVFGGDDSRSGGGRCH